jgi:hypothetical protein
MAEARWYPSTQQLGNPDELERTLREVLRLHYSLVDRHEELLKQVSTLKTPPKPK